MALSLEQFLDRVQASGLLSRADEVFVRMVAKKPEDRYQSMSEVIADLERCQSKSPLRFENCKLITDVALGRAEFTEALYHCDEGCRGRRHGRRAARLLQQRPSRKNRGGKVGEGWNWRERRCSFHPAISLHSCLDDSRA